MYYCTIVHLELTRTHWAASATKPKIIWLCIVFHNGQDLVHYGVSWLYCISSATGLYSSPNYASWPSVKINCPSSGLNFQIPCWIEKLKFMLYSPTPTRSLHTDLFEGGHIRPIHLMLSGGTYTIKSKRPSSSWILLMIRYPSFLQLGTQSTTYSMSTT